MSTDPAKRAPARRRIPFAVVGVLASLLAVGGLGAQPQPVAAAALKVAVVVGPMGSRTADYVTAAKVLAAQARSYGATVVEVYSPRATWSRVRTAATGANLLIYMGHGNGWPSPYGPFQTYTKDGMGLNATDNAGNSNNKYYGEFYVARDINMAANSVVILHRLCYASGNSEPGQPDPTLAVARKRVDNFAAGFLRTGARAVFAEGHAAPGYILYSLFKTNRTMLATFWASPNAVSTYRYSASSVRTPGSIAVLDPASPGKYYRSVTGELSMTAATWR